MQREVLTRVVDNASRSEEHSLTYLFAVVDSLPWVTYQEVDFWLDQLVWKAQHTDKEPSVKQRIWECISREMSGETGLQAAEWWINGGNNKLLPSSSPKL